MSNAARPRHGASARPPAPGIRLQSTVRLGRPALLEVRDLVGEGNPPVLRLLPNRSSWRWEVSVTESTDGNADMVRPQVGIPEHCRSTCRAEVLYELSSLLPIADIDFGRPFGVNMLPLEVGTNAEHRAGSPLTLATMAGNDGIGIGGYFDTQGTTTAMRGSRRSAPPSSAWARLQEGSCQSDRNRIS